MHNRRFYSSLLLALLLSAFSFVSSSENETSEGLRRQTFGGTGLGFLAFLQGFASELGWMAVSRGTGCDGIGRSEPNRRAA
jgi:purine-cytosine permease-like protein